MEPLQKNPIENKNIIELVRLNFESWNNALKSKEAKKVAELYAEDGVLLGTFSQVISVGKNQIQKYFEHFLLQNPTGKIIEEKIQSIDAGAYAHMGLYNFEVDSKDGLRQTVPARFTYIWSKDKNGEWKILHHHSSILPA
jgi:uncharacterized protein (TIGR02246 family)